MSEQAQQAFEAALQQGQPEQEPQNPVEGVIEGEEGQEQTPPPKAEHAEDGQSPEKDKYLSHILEVNARMDRQLRQLKKQMSEYGQKEGTQIDPELKKLAELKKNAKYNPMDWLEAAGLSYDDITAFELNGGKPTANKEVDELSQKIKQLEEERAKEREESGFQREVSEIKAEILQKRDDYPLLVAMGDQYSVIKDVQKEAAANGDELTRDQAAAKVEAYFQDQVKQDFERLREVPFVKELLKQEFAKLQKPVHNENTAQEQVITQPNNNAATNTLTNSMNQNAGKQQNVNLTDEERRARAIAALDLG